MSSVNAPSWAMTGAKVVFVGYSGPDAIPPVAADTDPRHQKRHTYTIARVEYFPGVGLWACWTNLGRLKATPLRCFRPLVTKTQAEDSAMFKTIANEAEKPLVNLTDALNRCWELYGVDE